MKNRLVVALAVLCGGCSVPADQTKSLGCTDPEAVNFDGWATDFDGSCAYQGSIVFWYGEDVADEMLSYGVQSLAFEVDDTIVGSTATSVYWRGAPDCDDPAAPARTLDMGNRTLRTAQARIYDPISGVDLWEFSVDMEANTCIAMQLTL